MPRLSPAAPPATKVEFVVSPTLDMMNAMYFTHLAGNSEGVEDWPAKLRETMAPDLLRELDALYSFPKGQPGIMGQFGDHLWAHPETWESIEAVIDYLRALPADMGQPTANPGIQGLVFYVVCGPLAPAELETADPGADPRVTLRAQLSIAGEDPQQALELYDDPEQLRARMIRLIQRFYDEHYRAEMAKRMPVLKRAAEIHQTFDASDPAALARQLSGRANSCIGGVCGGPFEKLYFSPSLDMGPYVSCLYLGSIHGLFYPYSPELEEIPTAADKMRLARIYKALGDEQRLSILEMLRGREMFVQEIVDQTGLHQSVVSRHLSFMHAVGLLSKRREGSMKYVSINPEMAETLAQTIDIFTASASGVS